MFCPNCGKSINEETKFCGYCGHSRTGEVSVFRQEQERTESLQNPTRTIQKSGEKRNFSRVLSFLLTGVLIVTAIFVTPLAKNYILDITLEQRGKRAEKNIIWLEKDYERIEPFFDGFAAVMKRDINRNWKWGYIDKSGKEVVEFNKYEWVGDFSEGVARVVRMDVEENKKYGYIDKTGREVVDLKYDDAESFSEGTAIVAKKNSDGKRVWGILNIR